MEVNDEAGCRRKAVDASPVPSKQVDHDSLMKWLPAGYRFKPTDHQLLVFLKRKLFNHTVPPSPIVEVNIYKHNPDFLAEKYGSRGEKELYCFTTRDKRYAHGKRPSRLAGDGYWKATSGDKEISCNGVKIGCKKALVFYMGKPPTKGVKTSWLMHEYALNSVTPTPQNEMRRFDDLFLCKIYKSDKSDLISARNRNIIISNPIAEAKYGSAAAMAPFGHPCHQDITTAPLSLDSPTNFNHSSGANNIVSDNPYGCQQQPQVAQEFDELAFRLKVQQLNLPPFTDEQVRLLQEIVKQKEATLLPPPTARESPQLFHHVGCQLRQQKLPTLTKADAGLLQQLQEPQRPLPHPHPLPLFPLLERLCPHFSQAGCQLQQQKLPTLTKEDARLLQQMQDPPHPFLSGREYPPFFDRVGCQEMREPQLSTPTLSSDGETMPTAIRSSRLPITSSEITNIHRGRFQTASRNAGARSSTPTPSSI